MHSAALAIVDEVESSVVRPLILDLDRTLLRTDLLHESLIWLLRNRPLQLLRVPGWLSGGRANLKARLASIVRLDFATMPSNPEVEALGIAAADAGRPVHIATASPVGLLDALGTRFSFVDRIFASIDGINLKGPAKAALLKREFPHGFDYVGDSRSDLAVWHAAGHATVFEGGTGKLRGIAQSAGLAVTYVEAQKSRRGVRRALRLHQWTKNLLVFVPLILAARYGDPAALTATLAAFLALSLVASGTYLLNDLLDIEQDRRHWSKHERPLASGTLRLDTGAGLAVAAVAGGLLLAALAAPAALGWIALYLLLTVSYSSWLKRIPLLDCFVLAGLFTLRLAVGTAAAGAPPSPWLFVFSMFVFASLSLAKRNTELLRAIEKGSGAGAARGYRPGDQPLVLGLGLATAISAVLVIILYLTNDAFSKIFYASVDRLWMLPALIALFLARIWLVSQRGELADDPTVFAARDPMCRGLGILTVASVGTALLL